jgi:hypothetical protein
MRRDILDHQGNKIGELDLPDGTPEEIWQSKLSVYAQAPSKNIPDVTPRQIRQALILSGISMSQIEDSLNTLPEPMRSLALVEWEYSISFKRDNKLVGGVSQQLGWTSEQVDQLWITASNL